MINQFGVLAYRMDAAQGLQILLVTSRDTGRWVVPKGNPMPDREGHETAALEAYEEAGAEGEVLPTPIGRFGYRKRRRLLPDADAEVLVYPMRIDRLLDAWPEAGQRRRQWFGREEAAAAVAEAELRQLILDFAPEEFSTPRH